MFFLYNLYFCEIIYVIIFIVFERETNNNKINYLNLVVLLRDTSHPNKLIILFYLLQTFLLLFIYLFFLQFK